MQNKHITQTENIWQSAA